MELGNQKFLTFMCGNFSLFSVPFLMEEFMRSLSFLLGNGEDSVAVLVPTEEMEMVKSWVFLWLSNLLLACLKFNWFSVSPSVSKLFFI